MRLEIRLATSPTEIKAARDLIARTYYEHYGVEFSGDSPDPVSNIEPYPDRFVMGMIGDDAVVAAGLYLRDTYVERYGKVTREEIGAVVEKDGLDPTLATRPVREYTKLVVKPGWEGFGIGRFFLRATHCRAFLCAEAGEAPPLLLACAKLSIFENLYEFCGIRSRPIKPFPRLEVHRLYSDATDPMESRLIVPELDIQRPWFELTLPSTFELKYSKKGLCG